MMILKKKEIIAASLVVLIGMAGYLNWSYQDTIHVRDNDSYVETGKMLGEAEMVSANNSVTEADENEGGENKEAEETAAEASSASSIEEARMNREAARSKAMEVLKGTSADEAVNDATRELAGEKLVNCANAIEKENEVESIAAAKGFSEICAYINEDTATITVRSEGLQPEEVQKLTDIVTSTCSIKAQNVRIVEIK